MVITHSLTHLDWVDRVLVVQQGRLAFDGTATEFRQAFPTGDLRQPARPMSLSRPADPTKGSPSNEVARKRRRLTSAAARGARETYQLLRREIVRLARSWGARLVVPLIILPLAFALMIDVAVQGVDTDLLGFLAVLSCIWMGGSLSLTTIVDERDVIDYERLLFLHVMPYVLAKTLTLWGLSVVQAAVFLVILQRLRLLQGEYAGLSGLFPWTAASLCLVTWAAVGLGLVLSAIAKWARSKELAQFLFPLVMMCQIVLSVQAHRPGGDVGLDRYRRFSWQPNEEDDHPFAARLSYLTLSRHADSMLASFAYRKQDLKYFTASNATANAKDSASRLERRNWFWSGALVLALIAIGLPIVTGGLLLLEELLRSQAKREAAVFREPTQEPRRIAEGEALAATGALKEPVEHASDA